MACEEHQLLADFIKSVHQNLRLQSRKFGDDVAWKLHCDQHEILEKYAVAMKELATKYWDPNAEDDNKKARSRIEWVAVHSIEYFFKGGKLKERLKEERKLSLYQQSQRNNTSTGAVEVTNAIFSSTITKETESEENFNCDPSRVLELIDVGSCYNPFKIYSFFNVLPIDLVPASSDVHQCDFLNANVITRPTQLLPVVDSAITELPDSSFDIVVFSLLLEYLPSPKQRYQSCLKAYRLLKLEGLLFIVTPDSKHSSANAPLMKSWRIALAHIGFVRVYYDKLTHIHCMAYRKCLHSVLAKQLWVSARDPCAEELMKIPQDFQEYKSEPSVKQVHFNRNDTDNELLTDMFNELPDIFE